jgi:hypothetical protein
MREERRFRDARPEYDERRRFEDRRRSAGDPYGRGRMRDLESEDYPGEPGGFEEEWEERRMRGRDGEWERRFEDRGYGERSLDRGYGRSARFRTSYGSTHEPRFRPSSSEWTSRGDWGSRRHFGELGDEFESRPRNVGWGSWRERLDEPRSYGSFYGGTRGELRGGSSYGRIEPRTSWSESRWGETGTSMGAGTYAQERNAPWGTQSFAGRGPKGYARSDDRIREDVSDVLMEHPAIDAGGIEVQVVGGNVTLTGSTTDRRTKRLAEDVVEDVSGVKDVQNHIRVVSAPDDNGQNWTKFQGEESKTYESTKDSKDRSKSLR